MLLARLFLSFSVITLNMSLHIDIDIGIGIESLMPIPMSYAHDDFFFIQYSLELVFISESFRMNEKNPIIRIVREQKIPNSQIQKKKHENNNINFNNHISCCRQSQLQWFNLIKIVRNEFFLSVFFLQVKYLRSYLANFNVFFFLA